MPNATFHVGSAHELPFPDRSFDLVLQFTVFSSIMSAGLRAAIATEMVRVARPGDGSSGTTSAWPGTADRRSTRWIGGRWPACSPGCDILARPSTLRWEILRRIVPTSRHAGLLLERLPPLNSHLIAVIRPPADPRTPANDDAVRPTLNGREQRRAGEGRDEERWDELAHPDLVGDASA